jgi:ferredoxin
MAGFSATFACGLDGQARRYVDLALFYLDLEKMMLALDAKKRITVTINDRETQVYAGLTILQALLQENIHLPHLCYDIRVERSNGNCGLCVVELGPEGREVKAC